MMIQRKECHRYVIEVCHTQRIQGNAQEEQYVERKNVSPAKITDSSVSSALSKKASVQQVNAV